MLRTIRVRSTMTAAEIGALIAGQMKNIEGRANAHVAIVTKSPNLTRRIDEHIRKARNINRWNDDLRVIRNDGHLLEELNRDPQRRTRSPMLFAPRAIISKHMQEVLLNHQPLGFPVYAIVSEPIEKLIANGIWSKPFAECFTPIEILDDEGAIAVPTPKPSRDIRDHIFRRASASR